MGCNQWCVQVALGLCYFEFLETDGGHSFKKNITATSLGGAGGAAQWVRSHHFLAKDVHLEWSEYVEAILVLAKCPVAIFFWVLFSSNLSSHTHLKTNLTHHISHFSPNCQNIILVQLLVFTRSLETLWHYLQLFSLCPAQRIRKSLGWFSFSKLQASMQRQVIIFSLFGET